MKCRLDLSRRLFDRVNFTESSVAFRVPEVLGHELSLLVWGATIYEPDPQLWQQLRDEVRERTPCPLYLAGWGALSFQGVTGGKAELAPYEPSFVSETASFLQRNGQPVKLTTSWPLPLPTEEEVYTVESLLETPFGWLTLDIAATGKVQLIVDPKDLVTHDMLTALSPRYPIDRFREGQLRTLLQSD